MLHTIIWCCSLNNELFDRKLISLQLHIYNQQDCRKISFKNKKIWAQNVEIALLLSLIIWLCNHKNFAGGIGDSDFNDFANITNKFVYT
jgi:hypothetical protein